MIPLHVPPLSIRETLAFPREDYATKLEDQLRDNLNKRGAVLTATGRDAIRLALRSLSLERHDKVLVPAYACQAIRIVVEQVCEPVYVDIDPNTLNMDVDRIESSITGDTRAILAVHLYGNPCDMERITDIAKSRKLAVIEDVAQGLGGSYRGRMLGSFGDFAVFSFRFSKDTTSFR